MSLASESPTIKAGVWTEYVFGTSVKTWRCDFEGSRNKPKYVLSGKWFPQNVVGFDKLWEAIEIVESLSGHPLAQTELDPAYVLTRWPQLPDHIRQTIMTLVRSVDSTTAPPSWSPLPQPAGTVRAERRSQHAGWLRVMRWKHTKPLAALWQIGEGSTGWDYDVSDFGSARIACI
jgi:hypothetical protein